MMRAFLFLFCLLLVHTSFAQSRFSFGVDFEGGITGKKHLDRNDYRTFAEGVLTSSENGQIAGPALSAGLWTDFQVFSFLSVRSGVSFRALQMSWYSWYDDQRPASPRANDYRYDYHLQAGYLELPTSIRLQIPPRSAACYSPVFLNWASGRVGSSRANGK